MIGLIRNSSSFTIVYFIIVLLCLFSRLLANETDYMYFFRPLSLIPLFLHFFLNSKGLNKKKRWLIMGALISFFLGEVFFSYNEKIGLSSAGILLYSVAKFLYCITFSNQKEFSSKVLKIYLSIIFVLIIVVMSLVFKNLGEFLLPVLVYLFATVFMSQYALMRKNEVNNESFMLGTIAMTTFIIADCSTALKYFYLNNQYIPQELLIFIYALTQYLIVTALVREKQEIVT